MADETTLPPDRPTGLVIIEPPYGGFYVRGLGSLGDEYTILAAFSTLQQALDWIDRAFRNIE